MIEKALSESALLFGNTNKVSKEHQIFLFQKKCHQARFPGVTRRKRVTWPSRVKPKAITLVFVACLMTFFLKQKDLVFFRNFISITKQ
jgi:hypothetical protein